MTELLNLLTFDEKPILSALLRTIVWYLDGIEAVGGAGWRPVTNVQINLCDSGHITDFM